MSDYTLKWYGRKMTSAVGDNFRKAMLENAADLAQRSSEQAPIDLGDLRGNVAINDKKLSSEGLITVGYNLPYAMRQHEELDYNHPRGGKAKYLEDPFNQMKQTYQDHAADAIGDAIK